jgi:nitrogen fixation protein NifU and related proteins
MSNPRVHRENVKEEYNKKIIELSSNPKNYGKPPRHTISTSQSYTGPCGDTMEFFLNIKDNIIQKASFTTNGCECATASASQTMLLIEGKTLDFAKKLTPEDIDNTLGGLPKDHKHCAELAIRTLKKALKAYKN